MKTTQENQVKHTPGPWAIEFERHGGRFHLRSETQGSFGHFCGWSSDGVTTVGEDDSNARLIAAAPELLAALIKCEFVLAECAIGKEKLSDLFPNKLADARAAIAKATGN